MTKKCFILSLLFLVGASSLRASAVSPEVITTYVDKYRDIAIEEMQRTGIPASIKLAQAILESNAGRSHLALQGNNHFGIKCGKYWQGKTVMREDDDYKHGKLIKSCFRAFPYAAFSFKAHSEFLLDPKKDYRYGFLFKLDPMDYTAWAKGLKKAGYATNPKYPSQLISIIERYQLYMYDQPMLATDAKEVIKEEVKIFEERVITKTEVVVVDPPIAASPIEDKKETRPEIDDFFVGVSTSYIIHVNNDINYVSTSYGDNLEAIALETGKTVDELITYNDYGYSAKQALPADLMIYIEAKKTKYQGSRETYRASKGETLYDVAQKFGIRMAKLLKRNRWKEGHQIKGGDVIYLKGNRNK